MWTRQVWWRHRTEVADEPGGEDARGLGIELMRRTNNREGLGNTHLLSAFCVPSSVLGASLGVRGVGGGG